MDKLGLTRHRAIALDEDRAREPQKTNAESGAPTPTADDFPLHLNQTDGSSGEPSLCHQETN